MAVGSTGKANNDRDHNDRDDWKKTPKGTAVTGGVSPETTFHHLIAYNNIWPTWNKLVSSADPATLVNKSGDANDWRGTEAGSAQACLTVWLELLGHAKPTDAMAAIVDAHGGGTPLDSEMQNWLSVNLLWTGWNIVEGPLRTIRADDPDESFDDFQEPLTLAGLGTQANVAVAVRNLNTAFTTFRAMRKEVKALRNIMVEDDTTAKEKTTQGEAIGKGLARRLRANPVKFPKCRDDYVDAFKNLASSFATVKDAVATTGHRWKSPLTAIDLRMWILLDPPRKLGMPWVTGTLANQTERIRRSLTQGMRNIQAIQTAINS